MTETKDLSRLPDAALVRLADALARDLERLRFAASPPDLARYAATQERFAEVETEIARRAT